MSAFYGARPAFGTLLVLLHILKMQHIRYFSRAQFGGEINSATVSLRARD